MEFERHALTDPCFRAMMNCCRNAVFFVLSNHMKGDCMPKELLLEYAESFPNEDNAEVGSDWVHMDGIGRYISQIQRYPLLAKKEERELLRRSFRGDASAKEELIVRNLRLVLKFARMIYSRRKPFALSFDDLVQAGNLGVMDAVDKFDPEKFNTRFSTYAVWHIEKRIWEAIYQEDRLVRFPVYMEKRIQQYLSFVVSHTREFGRTPAIVEVIARFGLAPDDIHECESLSQGGFLSLDASMDDEEGGATLADVIPSDEVPCDERFLWSEAAPMVETALNCLSPDDREILCGLVGAYAERKLPAVIAEERGIPQRDVTKRGYAAKAKVRRRLEQRGIRKRHFL